MADRFWAILAIGAFCAFVLFMVVRVGEIDLWIFVVAVLGMLGYDFFIELRDANGGKRNGA